MFGAKCKNLDYAFSRYSSLFVDVIEQDRENRFKGEKKEEKKGNHLREISVMSQQCRVNNIPISRCRSSFIVNMNY